MHGESRGLRVNAPSTVPVACVGRSNQLLCHYAPVGSQSCRQDPWCTLCRERKWWRWSQVNASTQRVHAVQYRTATTMCMWHLSELACGGSEETTHAYSYIRCLPLRYRGTGEDVQVRATTSGVGVASTNDVRALAVHLTRPACWNLLHARIRLPPACIHANDTVRGGSIRLRMQTKAAGRAAMFARTRRPIIVPATSTRAN